MNYILSNQETVLAQITQLESAITQTEVINSVDRQMLRNIELTRATCLILVHKFMTILFNLSSYLAGSQPVFVQLFSYKTCSKVMTAPTLSQRLLLV